MREQEKGVRNLSGRTREREEATHDLEFDGLSLQLDSPNLEINTNGRDVALRIGVVSESKEQARLFSGRGLAGVVDKSDGGAMVVEWRECVPFRRLNRR
jgi:hypothetical protein